MRKLSFLLALCMMLACLASCELFGKDSDDDASNTANTSDTAEPLESDSRPSGETTAEGQEESKTPETPQDKWTARY